MKIKIHEFPIYHIDKTRNGNCIPCWNVICATYGNSGYLYSEEAVKEWIAKHITSYVKLSDHQPVVDRLSSLESRVKELGYSSIEQALSSLKRVG